MTTTHRRNRRHLTYANAMSTLAVFLVVAGGGAVAANSIVTSSRDVAKQAIRNTDVARNTIKSNRLKDGKGVAERDLVADTLGGDSIDEARLGKVPAAADADHAGTAARATRADTATSAETAATATSAQSAETATTADTAANATLFADRTLGQVRGRIGHESQDPANQALTGAPGSVLGAGVPAPSDGADMLVVASVNLQMEANAEASGSCFLQTTGIGGTEQISQSVEVTSGAVPTWEIQLPLVGFADVAGGQLVEVLCEEQAGDLEYDSGDIAATVIPTA